MNSGFPSSFDAAVCSDRSAVGGAVSAPLQRFFWPTAAGGLVSICLGLLLFIGFSLI